jgi:hypothetical protein
MLSNSAGVYNAPARLRPARVGETGSSRFGEAGYKGSGREPRLVRTRTESLELAFDFGERARELLAACGVCRRLKLAAHFRVRQTQRFRSPQLLGIAIALRHGATCTLFFPLIHAFLDTVLLVDKSFA